MEAFRTTPNIRAICNIVQDPWIGIQNRIDKSNGTFTDGVTFFIELDTTSQLNHCRGFVVSG